MPLMPGVSDERLTDVVTRFARLAGVVLRDPERWLGWDDAEADDPLLRRAVAAAGDVVLGRRSPATAGWAARSAEDRADWWVSRIGNLAGLLAATPRFAGVAADRLPIQAALGASVSGLAVCAVAREHGVEDPDDWVPLLGKVLFDRDLRAPVGGDSPAASAAPDPGLDPERVLTAEPGAPIDAGDDAGDVAGTLAGSLAGTEPLTAPSDPAHPPLVRARRTLWGLARTFLAVQGMFDERPRGARVFRALGKVPVVGLLGGWLDERGGVRQAAAETVELVTGGRTR